MLLAMAWRNLWRNSRRTLITITALTVGVAGIVGLYSFRETANQAIVRDITTGLLGDLQVHGAGYQEAPSISTVVSHPVQVEATLEQALPGAKAERRVVGAGLAGSGDKSAPVMVLGVESREGTDSLYTVKAGHDATAPNEVVVGKDLATELNLSPGAELVLVSQAADGSVANDRYTVAGTFVSSSGELDGNAVAMPLKTAQDFFGLGDAVHQLVVRLPSDREDLTPEVKTLRAALDAHTLEALSWSEMLPEVKASMDGKRKSQGVMDFVIFLIVGLGVFNAMTMSVFERTREFGVLTSLGTRPGRILGLVMLESLLQALIGFALGLTLATVALTAAGSVDLGAMMGGGDVMGVKMPERVQLGLLPASITSAATVAFFTAVLGALLPALRAARMPPVEALRHT